MIYANREATRRAIRAMISKESNGISKSYKDNTLPSKNEKAGIHYKYFRNALGAELLYK